MTQIKVELSDSSYSSCYQAGEFPMGAPGLASASPSQSPEPGCRYKSQEAVSQDIDRTFNVFVGGLRTDTTKADLETSFGQCGRIVSAKVLQKPDRRGKLYGFVNFDSQDAQRRALSRDGVVIKNVSVRVRPQHEVGERKRKRHTEVDPARSLFIGNVPYHLPTERLQDMIEQKGGPTIEVRMKEGFAFVVYDTIESAELALEKLNGAILEPSSDPLFVEFVRSPSERDAISSGSPVEEVERHRRTVFISNLPPDIGDGDLHANFSRYGHITTVYIPRNAQNTVKGYAFLEFSKRSEAHRSAVGGPVQIRDRLVQVRKSLIQNSDRRKGLPGAAQGAAADTLTKPAAPAAVYPFPTTFKSSSSDSINEGSTEAARFIAIMKAAFEAGAKAGVAERQSSCPPASPELPATPLLQHPTPPAPALQTQWASPQFNSYTQTRIPTQQPARAVPRASVSPPYPTWQLNSFSAQTIQPAVAPAMTCGPPATPNPAMTQYWKVYMDQYNHQCAQWYENMQKAHIWNMSREATPDLVPPPDPTRSRTRSLSSSSKSNLSSEAYGAYRPRRSHRTRNHY